MKPLPTLTKPLRSVDIATHEPAEALRERTDSCTVPAAGVVGEAMVALVLADAYRQKFGGDHIDDVRARAVRAYDASAIGVRTRPDRLHGRRQVDRRRRLADALGVAARSTATRCWSSASGTRSPDEFERSGEASFRAAEEQLVCELLDERRPRRRDRARRRRRAVRARARALRTAASIDSVRR